MITGEKIDEPNLSVFSIFAVVLEFMSLPEPCSFLIGLKFWYLLYHNYLHGEQLRHHPLQILPRLILFRSKPIFLKG